MIEAGERLRFRLRSQQQYAIEHPIELSRSGVSRAHCLLSGVSNLEADFYVEEYRNAIHFGSWQAMTFYTAEYGIKHIETVNTMNKLAGVLMLLGKHSEAYPLLRNAKDVRELLLGAILCIPPQYCLQAVLP